MAGYGDDNDDDGKSHLFLLLHLLLSSAAINVYVTLSLRRR